MRKQYYAVIAFLFAAILFFAWHYRLFPFGQIPYLRIPVEFTAEHIPYTIVEIEGMKCPMLIDLGSSSECGLRKELLAKISKQFIQLIQLIDIQGRERESHEYLIPEIKLSNSWIKKVRIKEETYLPPPDNTSIWVSFEEAYKKDGILIDGRIGWGLLASFYPVFDLGNSVLYFTRGEKTFPDLEKNGYRFKNLHPAPLEVNFIGCVLTVDTTLGRKKFLLDTGCTRSLIKTSLVDPKNVQTITDEKKVTTLNNVSIGDYLIGDMEFLLLDFHKIFEDIDGILGMDFFTKNIVYLNFKEQQALIGSSQTLNHP